MRIFILLSTLFIITACGGGGGDSSEQSPPPVAVVPPAPPIVTKTADLVSTSNFEFMSSYELMVQLPASKPNGRYFINICSEFSSDSPADIVYESCKVRTFLGVEAQQIELTLSESERNLIAQIWPIESSAEPITYYFNTSQNKAEWQILF